MPKRKNSEDQLENIKEELEVLKVWLTKLRIREAPKGSIHHGNEEAVAWDNEGTHHEVEEGVLWIYGEKGLPSMH